MEMHEEKLFTVGELARTAGVTVRTLQYYDQYGLLNPKYSEGGRRLYNRYDVIRLQQILFLKSLDFSLEEIRDRLLPVQSAVELERILIRQNEVLLAEISRLQEVAGMIKKAINETQAGGEIGIDKFVAIMELMQQGKPYFILRYFGNDQVKHLQNCFDNPNQAIEISRRWDEIFAELIELYRKGADPAGPEGQELASRWWEMVKAFTGDNRVLLETLMTAGRDIDNWPGETGELKQAIKIYLQRALAMYFGTNGIQLSKREEERDG